MNFTSIFCLLLYSVSAFAVTQSSSSTPEIIHFQSGKITLGGELYKPKGDGPFPTILYNHGSAPGMLNSQAAAIIAPLFVSKGWAFFMPYRRGQGLSEKAGKYVVDEIFNAQKSGGEKAGVATMIRLLSGEQFTDQMAAFTWLKNQKWVSHHKIAIAGNSFGGIETVLANAHEKFCAAIDASGAAESWDKAPELQELMKKSVKKALSPIMFFQAENDFNVEPSKILSAEMKLAEKIFMIKIYPPFGSSPKDGHSFAYRGASIWFPDVFSFLIDHCD